MNKKKSLALPLNFLLGCSEKSLDDFELARLAEVADLRKELLSILDRLIDQMSQAALTAWFRTTDREMLKQALENPDDIIALAKEQIRDGERSEEELIPLTSLPPGAAHLAAALRYQERQIAKGLCSVCPEPLAHNSVRYCERHLTAARLRHKPKNAKGELPGNIGWLYDEGGGLRVAVAASPELSKRLHWHARSRRKRGRRRELSQIRRDRTYPCELPSSPPLLQRALSVCHARF